MKDVEHFLETWNKAKSPEAFIETGIELPDPEKVRAYLESLPAKDKQEKTEALATIMNVLEDYTKNLEEQMDATAQQLKDTRAAEDATQAYTKADATGNKDDENS
ncbi:MAG: hypothetical protein CMH25_05975 [Micavibrio sp.]|nr:hypothetical protein [Micavibrio sp.]|tara:strand:- start:916 stop:1230 length:315 start_codon:yes stop_codon:yes gene_type:complete